MSEPKHVSPLLDGYAVGSAISEHDGIRCCPAIKETNDQKYILKIISIPASQTQMDALLMAGAYKDEEQAMVYYRELAEDVVQEAIFLKEISRLEGFLPYENWQLEPITRHRLGYEIYLLSPYKRSLEKHVRRNPVTHLEAINLGLDLCSALRVCREAGALYVDLKPSNIYVSDTKEYFIGDLGFIPLDSLSYTAMPAKYHSRYTAPELLDPMTTINLTADTYAVGMILYQLYNEGALPPRELPEGERLPSPVNADYELAEIILKAIDPDPEKRWQDPRSMGQALASYMQRNVVNDVPITPYDPIDTEAQNVRILSPDIADAGSDIMNTAVFAPITQAMIDAAAGTTPQPEITVEEPAEPEMAEEAAEAPAAEEKTEPESDPANPADDEEEPAVEPAVQEPEPEAAPEEAPKPMGEMEKILAKADELAAHETPAGVVIPEIPDTPDRFAFATEDTDEAEDLTVPMDPVMDTPTEKKEPKKRKKRFLSPLNKRRARRLLSALITLLVLALLAFGGYPYYLNQYLLTIDDIRVDGATDSLKVYVDTSADTELISVICSDSYGNSTTKLLTGGMAEFTGLIPNTMYRIELEVEGFHDLIGKTSDIFTTRSTTEIVSFTAVTGDTDGSTVLSFTVDGEEPREWAVIYSAEGEEEIRRTFLGHTVSIDGLTIGKVYTFTLDPGSSLSLEGETSVEFMASRLILAENLTASTTNGTDMTIRWTTPGDLIVDSWEVRCYSPGGYEETMTVSDTSAYLTAIDPAFSYTIEVTAAGMTQPARTSITANPINITAVNVDETDLTQLTVSWEYAGAEPKGGWLLLYSIDGGSDLNVLKCSKASAVISPRIPDASYQFTIQAADGTSIFSNVHPYICPEAPGYDHHSVKAENITAYLLKTPEDKDWNYEKISNDSFTDQLQLGDSLSVVLKSDVDFYLTGAETDIMYVFRDAYGNVIPGYIQHDAVHWKHIWNGGSTRFGELDIPGAPDKAGSYVLRIYFDGEFIAEAPFTISE